MIAKDGIPYLGVALVVTAALAAAGLFVLAGLAFLGFVFLTNFFRDPERIPDSADPLDVISPADGVVIRVGEIPAGERLPECADLPVGISIFMNVFDVHVNRSPADGVIAAAEHTSGLKLPADHQRAQLENERNLVRLDTEAGPLVFIQVAGLLARRIVFRKKAGDRVSKGERVGMIKFGSRVDLYFQAGTVPAVRDGERTWAGKSVVARLAEKKG